VVREFCGDWAEAAVLLVATPVHLVGMKMPRRQIPPYGRRGLRGWRNKVNRHLLWYTCRQFLPIALTQQR
jgi:hypothetical protein